MRAILIHGKDTSSTEKWYPWFKSELEKHGLEVIVPDMPEADDPKLEAWLKIIEDLKPDENTVLVGHSRGGVAVLRYLENMSTGTRVRKVLLVAANSGLLQQQAIPSENSNDFYTEGGFNFTEIKKHCSEFVVYHSKDDPWVPFEQGRENSKGLGAKFVIFENKKHFGKDSKTVPGLIFEIAGL